jgi:hypothetical protein
MLLVGGLPQEAHGPNELHAPNLHGHNPTYTVEGTDVTIVNTNSARCVFGWIGCLLCWSW